jgi:hypothetical protein
MADSSIKPASVETCGDLGLTADEDNELRQLTWFSLVGHLSDASQARLLELRAKDRRSKVRNPRPDPSASRMDVPEAPASPPRVVPDHQAPQGNFICPNCGFVQRGIGLA